MNPGPKPCPGWKGTVCTETLSGKFPLCLLCRSDRDKQRLADKNHRAWEKRKAKTAAGRA